MEPDEPQTVRFKKSDKIATIVIALLFLLGIIVGTIKNGRGSEYNEENTELATDESEGYDDSEEMADNDVLRVGEAIEILSSVVADEEASYETTSKIKELMTDRYLYTRGANTWEGQNGEFWVFYKDCRQEGDNFPLPVNKSTASVVAMGVNIVQFPEVSITVFTEQRYERLKQQLYGRNFSLTRSDDYGEYFENMYYEAFASWSNEYGMGGVSIRKKNE